MRDAPPPAEAPLSLRFGEELVVLRPPIDDRLAARAEREGLALRSIEPTPTGAVYLVVERGWTFQERFREARLLFEKEHFALFELPRKVEVPRRGHHFTARVVLDSEDLYHPAASPEEEPRAEVVALLAELTASSIETDLAPLLDFKTRLSWTHGFHKAAAWCEGQLSALGANVSAPQTFRIDGKKSCNVVAEWPGQEEKALLVTAHLDSINELAANDTDPAPGANDNASGVASILAVARIVAPLIRKGKVPKLALRLLLFGGEEQVMRGSINYVSGLKETEFQNVGGVLNLDMIGYQPPTALVPTVFVHGTRTSLRDRVGTLGRLYTSLSVQESSAEVLSDHLSFGVRPAICSIHAGKYPDYHRDSDTLAKLDLALAVEITRMNLAYVLETAVNL